MIHFPMAQTRRSFVRNAPLAAAAALPLAASPSFQLWSQTPDAAAPHPAFQLFTAQAVAADLARLQAAPGNNDLVASKQLAASMTLTVEQKKSAPEFEFHEHRDHIFQILDGSTTYEIGGTPQNPRQTRPGEWLAPASEGFSKVTLNKGDMLLVPRSVPHRRITEQQVTFLLISATTPA
jgi:mannose-6-phosphate isomerase-like protein (cupin superfamily)